MSETGKVEGGLGWVEVFDRVGHVFEWEKGSLRKIYLGHKFSDGRDTTWLHMPCKKVGDKHVIQGPTHTECGAIIYYWINEERVAGCKLVSVEEFTEEDKQEMAKPAAPRCTMCSERREASEN